jgi:hypothetical protein
MIKAAIYTGIFILLAGSGAIAQEALPRISAKNFGGRIVISWKNEYTAPLSTINIQRSFDSLRNYSTIGSVLNPANRENGFADASAPYSRMYYRVFIGFENGSFVYSPPVRAEPDENTKPYGGLTYNWQYSPPPLPIERNQPKDSIVIQSARKDSTPVSTGRKIPPTTGKPAVSAAPPAEEKKNLINYVSLNQDQNVSLFLPGAADKQYSVIFYDESGKQVFQLNRLKEDLLIIEKVNFMHSGWFNYELFETGQLLIRDKIFIPKDHKSGTDSRRSNN